MADLELVCTSMLLFSDYENLHVDFDKLIVSILIQGIGRPPGQMDPKAFLLQNFNKTARERVSLS